MKQKPVTAILKDKEKFDNKRVVFDGLFIFG